jgi:hypothetical protein
MHLWHDYSWRALLFTTSPAILRALLFMASIIVYGERYFSRRVLLFMTGVIIHGERY